MLSDQLMEIQIWNFSIPLPTTETHNHASSFNRTSSSTKTFLEECHASKTIKRRILKAYDSICILIQVYDYFDIFLKTLIWDINLNISFWSDIDPFDNKSFVATSKFQFKHIM